MWPMALLCGTLGWHAMAAALPQHERINHNASTLRQALIRAEKSLADKAPDAAALFEHASHVEGESATAEIGMVRAYMAGGQYRRALSYAHLVQGEHTSSTEAQAWTALLSDRSGQTLFALRGLEVARAAQPDDVALLCAQSEIFIDRQQPERAAAELDAWLARNKPQAVVINLRYRAAVATKSLVSQDAWRKLIVPTTWPSPYATRDAETGGTWIPPYFTPLAAARESTLTTASGVSVDPSHVVTTASGLGVAGTRIRVRDAQGNVRNARIEVTLEDVSVALLKLDRALPDVTPLSIAERVFPGSPFHAVGFPVAGSTYPSFPRSTPGFFQRPQEGVVHGLSLGVALPSGMAGAPVLSAGGQLAGFVTSSPQSGDMLFAWGVLKRLGLTPSSADTLARLSNEEIYERALGRVVLVATTIAD
jgi:hypothetical protein